MIETGQDPRRFTEDLLRRLRDLVIVAAVPDAPATGLIDVSEDQGERLVAQAARFGSAELSRAADIVATGLTEMRGATAPRLLLELICARVLLPGADHATDGVLARLDRLEKRAAISGGAPSGGPVAATPPPAPAQHPVEPVAEASVPAEPEPVTPPAPPAQPVQEVDRRRHPGRAGGRGARRARAAEPEPVPAASSGRAGGRSLPRAGSRLVDVRRLWPDIVEATKLRRRVAWIHLTQNSQVVGVDGKTLTLGFANAGARDSFVNGGCDEILRQAAIDVVGVDWRVEAIVDPGAKADPAPAATAAAAAGRRPAEPQAAPTDPPSWAADDADAPAAAAPAPEPPQAAAERVRRPAVHRGRARRDRADPAGRRVRARERPGRGRRRRPPRRPRRRQQRPRQRRAARARARRPDDRGDPAPVTPSDQEVSRP